jgi:hypothetical protein
MDERRFRGLFHDTVGEAPIPPDLQATARRALRRPVERTPSRLVRALAAMASILLVAAIIGYNLVSHYRPTPAGRSAGPSPAASSAPLPSPTPSSTVVQACTANQLTLTPGGTQGAAGHMFAGIKLTNSSALPCTIFGFPTAQLLASDQTQVPTRVVDRGGQLSNTPAPAGFLLSPAHSAEFQVSWGDVPVGNETCRSASTIEIGPPGQAPSATLALTHLSITICNSGELDASALLVSN